MKRSVYLWQLIGFAVTSLAGTLLHFLYEWTGESILAASFSGVNESTWEHMKLLFWPMLAFAAIQIIYFKEKQNFWCVKLKGTALGLTLIPVLFYTYNGVIGRSPDWANIAMFFVAAAAAYIFEARLLNKDISPCRYARLSAVLLCIIGMAFVCFTFVTPHLGIFRDPVTGAYGI